MKISCTGKVFAHAKEAVQRQLEEVENQFSPGEKKGSSPLVVELYQQAQKIYNDSSGFFDLTIGPLSSLWGFHEKKYRIPSPEEISAALKRIGMHQIHVDQSGLIIPPEIELDWGGGAGAMTEKMVEYAAVVFGTPGKKICVNFVTRVTAECDCLAKDDPRIVPDIGIVMGTDPVAVDQACYDLVCSKAGGFDPFRKAHPNRDCVRQLDYAESMGIGVRSYNLVEVATV